MTEMVNTDIQVGNTVYTYVGILTTESFKKKKRNKNVMFRQKSFVLKVCKKIGFRTV